MLTGMTGMYTLYIVFLHFLTQHSFTLPVYMVENVLVDTIFVTEGGVEEITQTPANQGCRRGRRRSPGSAIRKQVQFSEPLTKGCFIALVPLQSSDRCCLSDMKFRSAFCCSS